MGDASRDAVAGQDLERRTECWLGERVRVFAEVDGAGDAEASPVFADGLRGGQDVVLVELAVIRAAAVTGGAEGDQLLGVVQVRRRFVVGRDEPRDVLQQAPGGFLSSQGTFSHGSEVAGRRRRINTGPLL